MLCVRYAARLMEQKEAGFKVTEKVNVGQTVTGMQTFTNLYEIWANEVELYSTNHECIKILVGNKVDRQCAIFRTVSREEGMALAQEHKSSFLECSAQTRENVHQCFKDLILKILEVPALLEKGSEAVKKQILQQKQVCEAPLSNGCWFQ
ncbi:ras-related protein RABC2a-like [Durio zibethinus]|uniref:Ras-related protein RABC2a-like n=1 Tax=Durio zibethinus TaxID=66656 RepID=A0A6P5WPR6_DURZI|nr:ras-related protein RABC2a-like [Durio zibethinus]